MNNIYQCMLILKQLSAVLTICLSITLRKSCNLVVMLSCNFLLIRLLAYVFL